MTNTELVQNSVLFSMFLALSFALFYLNLKAGGKYGKRLSYYAMTWAFGITTFIVCRVALKVL